MRCIVKLVFEGTKEAYMFFDTVSKKEAVNDAKRYLSYYVKNGYDYKIVGMREWKNPRMRIYAGQTVYQVQVFENSGYIRNFYVNHLTTIKSVYNYTKQVMLRENLVVIIYDYYQKEKLKNELKNIKESICQKKEVREKYTEDNERQKNVKTESDLKDYEKIDVRALNVVDDLISDKKLKKSYFKKELKKYYKGLVGDLHLKIFMFSLLVNPLILSIYAWGISAILGVAPVLAPNLIIVGMTAIWVVGLNEQFLLDDLKEINKNTKIAMLVDKIPKMTDDQLSCVVNTLEEKEFEMLYELLKTNRNTKITMLGDKITQITDGKISYMLNDLDARELLMFNDLIKDIETIELIDKLKIKR